MDISLQIFIANPPTPAFRRGDIIGVYDAAAVTGLPRLSNQGWVHISIPDGPDGPAAHLRRLARRLGRDVRWRRIKTVRGGNGDVSKYGPREVNELIRRGKLYRVDILALPAPRRRELLETQQVNLTWPQARGVIVRRVIADPDDETQDTETAITDEEVR